MISWIAAASWSNRTLGRPSAIRQWPYQLPEFLGYALLLGYVNVADNGMKVSGNVVRAVTPLWHVPVEVQWVLVAICAGGIAFTWWARIHLGKLWSGYVTRKEGHRVIDSGPYAIVRHPIYTGLLTAAIATICIKASPLAMAGCALLIGAYIIKGRLEENFLSEELGAENYAAYKRRVPMLVPFLPVGN